MTTSVIDENQRNIANIFMTDHSIYFRPNMSTNFDLYIFSYFSLCLIGVNIRYFGSHIQTVARALNSQMCHQGRHGCWRV